MCATHTLSAIKPSHWLWCVHLIRGKHWSMYALDDVCCAVCAGYCSRLFLRNVMSYVCAWVLLQCVPSTVEGVSEFSHIFLSKVGAVHKLRLVNCGGRLWYSNCLFCRRQYSINLGRLKAIRNVQWRFKEHKTCVWTQLCNDNGEFIKHMIRKCGLSNDASCLPEYREEFAWFIFETIF